MLSDFAIEIISIITIISIINQTFTTKYSPVTNINVNFAEIFILGIEKYKILISLHHNGHNTGVCAKQVLDDIKSHDSTARLIESFTIFPIFLIQGSIIKIIVEFHQLTYF